MTAGTFRTGMKVYDNDWFLRFDLDYDDAARLLGDWGVTFVLAQSRYLPMPDTAIKSEVPERLKDRYAAYDDRLFREALRRVRIQYVATCLVGLDPEAVAADPNLVPVDANGRAGEKIDWYQGIPPDRTAHIDRKIALVERAAQELRPDGVHLCFMRWPGFWETWLPDTSRADFPDYDHSRGTLNRFAEQTGVEVPETSPREAAQWIVRNARAAWIDWKCATVAGVIGRFRDAVRAGDTSAFRGHRREAGRCGGRDRGTPFALGPPAPGPVDPAVSRRARRGGASRQPARTAMQDRERRQGGDPRRSRIRRRPRPQQCHLHHGGIGDRQRPPDRWPHP